MQTNDLWELGRRALPWVVLLFAAIFVLGLALRIKRYLHGRAEPADPGQHATWTVQQLREMHARGELDDAEFELLRTRAIVDAADRQLWTLQDLRDMHARGELSDEELAMARARLIAAVNPSAGSASSDESPTSAGAAPEPPKET
jgi:hypothetical protein